MSRKFVDPDRGVALSSRIWFELSPTFGEWVWQWEIKWDSGLRTIDLCDDPHDGALEAHAMTSDIPMELEAWKQDGPDSYRWVQHV